jgi:hypothetical protein
MNHIKVLCGHNAKISKPKLFPTFRTVPQQDKQRALFMSNQQPCPTFIISAKVYLKLHYRGLLDPILTQDTVTHMHLIKQDRILKDAEKNGEVKIPRVFLAANTLMSSQSADG